MTTAARQPLAPSSAINPGIGLEGCDDSEIRDQRQFSDGAVVQRGTDGALVWIDREDRSCKSAFKKISGQADPTEPA
jgi:hypothetical protein